MRRILLNAVAVVLIIAAFFTVIFTTLLLGGLALQLLAWAFQDMARMLI